MWVLHRVCGKHYLNCYNGMRAATFENEHRSLFFLQKGLKPFGKEAIVESVQNFLHVSKIVLAMYTYSVVEYLGWGFLKAKIRFYT